MKLSIAQPAMELLASERDNRLIHELSTKAMHPLLDHKTRARDIPRLWQKQPAVHRVDVRT